jgi:hypothetical protein
LFAIFHDVEANLVAKLTLVSALFAIVPWLLANPTAPLPLALLLSLRRWGKLRNPLVHVQDTRGIHHPRTKIGIPLAAKLGLDELIVSAAASQNNLSPGSPGRGDDNRCSHFFFLRTTDTVCL